MPARGGKKEEQQKHRPATTVEGRENQIIALAIDEAERRIRSGTATSQELSHFLKLGSTRERLEQERLRQENDLLKAKIQALGDAADMKELYENAIHAMRGYTGQQDDGYYQD